MSEVILEMQSVTEEIGTITETIQSISDETNLLAIDGPLGRRCIDCIRLCVL